jgi:hypothetical protein
MLLALPRLGSESLEIAKPAPQTEPRIRLRPYPNLGAVVFGALRPSRPPLSHYLSSNDCAYN